ncbi:MAG: CaiB/BaiF CoA transferase family protein [Dehalococcoidia bacterium]
MTSALDGLIVIDTTTEFFSSLGVALLADFGADVIRIDAGASLSPDYHHRLANRNKRSVRLDLDSDIGRQAARDLAAKADVFVTDAALNTLVERGLDYEMLSTDKPDLIYARASGFGPKGPDNDLPPLDELAAARTGMMPILPQPGQPPVYPQIGGQYTAVMLAFGVMTALHHREETGEGQEVDVSLLAGNMYGASLDLQAYLAIGGERFLRPVSRMDAGNPMSGTLYVTSDGLWVTLTMPDTDRWWPDLSEIVGLDADDSRFNSHELRCEVNRLELIDELARAFERKPADHWRRLFTERQMSADIIERYDFPVQDEQAYNNRYILESDGGQKMIGFPIFMADTPAEMKGAAPTVGEHSSEVLGDVLGFGEDEIAKATGS